MQIDAIKAAKELWALTSLQADPTSDRQTADTMRQPRRSTKRESAHGSETILSTNAVGRSDS